MITSSDIQEKLKQRPFLPFRVIMSSGDKYDIHHPDLVLVGKRHLFVGTASEDNPALFDRSSLLSILPIAALEVLSVEAASGGSNGQK